MTKHVTARNPVAGGVVFEEDIDVANGKGPMPQVRLKRLPGAYAVSRLASATPLPEWADGPGFVSISRTEDELSIVCLEARVPVDIATSEGGWVCFKFQGPFAFDETGILSAVLRPLSENGIGIFAVSTFDTDYLLIKAENAARGVELLASAGHILL